MLPLGGKMTVQFTGELDFRTPLGKEEKKEFSELIESIKRAMIAGHMPSLYFFEDVVHKRDLQNEFVHSVSFLKEDKMYKRSYPLPINKNSFNWSESNHSGNILSLNLEGIEPVEHSCIYLKFERERFKNEIIDSMQQDDTNEVLRVTPIFWEVWKSFNQQ